MLDNSICGRVLQRLGPCSIDPLCFQIEQSVAEVCELAPRSIRCGNRCIPDVVDKGNRVCLSPICSDWQVPSESTAGRQLSSSGSSNLEHSALEPNSSGDMDRLSSSFTGRSVPTAGPLQQTSSTSPNEPAPVSRLEGIRANHSAEGISKRASTLILSGWSKGTNATYQSAWSKWHSWCVSRKVNPFSCDVKFFLDFLAEMFEKGLQHTIPLIQSDQQYQ